MYVVMNCVICGVFVDYFEMVLSVMFFVCGFINLIVVIMIIIVFVMNVNMLNVLKLCSMVVIMNDEKIVEKWFYE